MKLKIKKQSHINVMREREKGTTVNGFERVVDGGINGELA